MRSSKKLASTFFPAVLCMLVMLLAACGGSGNGSGSTAKAAAKQQIYVRALPGFSDVKTLDPPEETDLYSTQAIMTMFTGLVTLNDRYQVVDQLAASHTVSSDGLTYTFTLKPNLKFSDGTPLTSADVAYSIDRALDPATKSPIATAYLGLIKDANARAGGQVKSLIGDSLLTPDSNTIIIKTSQKAAYFLDTLTMPSAFVVEKSLVEKYGLNNWTSHLNQGGGDGPFKLLSHTPGKNIEFVPNPDYYGPKPQLSKFVIAFYSKDTTAYQSYINNQIDSTSVPTDDLSTAKALPEGQYHTYPVLSNSYIAMNYLTKPFDNINIRQAFDLAINKDEITQTVYKGVYIPTNHIVPQGMPGYNPGLTGPGNVSSTTGNETLAKQLFQKGLQQEGLTLQTLPPITFTTSTNGSADASNTDALLQQRWKTVLGVNVTVNDIDFNKLLDETQTATNNAKGIQMWIIGWIADYPDPQDWLTLQFDKGSPQNNMNYGQNTTSDATQQQQNQVLMEQADANTGANRMQQYEQAEQQAVNDVAWLPLYQQAVSSVRKACVVGVPANNQDLTPPDDWGSIYKTTDSNCANVSQY